MLPVSQYEQAGVDAMNHILIPLSLRVGELLCRFSYPFLGQGVPLVPSITVEQARISACRNNIEKYDRK